MENARIEGVKKSVQDAAYIAVGVGVLGAQQAQSRVGEARERLESLGNDLRERVDPVVAKVTERVDPLIGDVKARVEPAVSKFEHKAKEIADIGVTKAKAWLGREEVPPASTKAA